MTFKDKEERFSLVMLLIQLSLVLKLVLLSMLVLLKSLATFVCLTIYLVACACAYARVQWKPGLCTIGMDAWVIIYF